MKTFLTFQLLLVPPIYSFSPFKLSSFKPFCMPWRWEKKRNIVPFQPRNQFIMKTRWGGSRGHWILSANLTVSVFPVGIDS